MRVLTVEPGPAFSVADVHRGWVKALRQLGCDVKNLNLEDRLQFYSEAALKRKGRWRKALLPEEAVGLAAQGIHTAAFQWWPDLVVVTSCFFVPTFVLEVLRSRGMRVALLLTESPYEDDNQLERAEFADLVLLNDPTNLERFREVNPNTHYTPHSYDPELHHPGPVDPDKASDFCFVGTGFPSRIEFFEQIDWTHLEVLLAGNWQDLSVDSCLREFLAHPFDECVDNSETVQIYNSAKASANIYRREAHAGETADGWAMGPREVELAACGTFYLTEARGENRAVLPMVPTFTSADDFSEQLRWYLDRDDERERIAFKAREAIADRTFEAAASRALNLLA